MLFCLQNINFPNYLSSEGPPEHNIYDETLSEVHSTSKSANSIILARVGMSNLSRHDRTEDGIEVRNLFVKYIHRA